MNGQVEFKASAPHDGGPAFPISDPQSAHATAMAASIHIEDPAERERAYILARAAAVIGMSMRDYFAAQALPGALMARADAEGDFNPAAVAAAAYVAADAMLRARSA